jgi:hypothetical protein
MGLLLLILLIVLLFGASPAWPYSRSWGYGPSGIVGLLPRPTHRVCVESPESV